MIHTSLSVTKKYVIIAGVFTGQVADGGDDRRPARVCANRKSTWRKSKSNMPSVLSHVLLRVQLTFLRSAASLEASERHSVVRVLPTVAKKKASR